MREIYALTIDRYKVLTVLKGHSSFVNCLAPLPPSRDFPKGAIATGGQDSRILIFCLGRFSYLLVSI